MSGWCGAPLHLERRLYCAPPDTLIEQYAQETRNTRLLRQRRIRLRRKIIYSDMLKKLEIHGFKSFADKTALTFPAGITAVVGPNGSGKSNVVDAIRWVLGEQSAKHIRVGSATDVLFNGMGQKPAAGFASVSLEFDNGRKQFPIDFGEVQISRKVYRDGTSDYQINKRSARLKDVTHLLAAAKLGVKGMGIVNQGAADVFLRANAVERREMLEEMIGLKEFRLKKEEAERRIKETRDNLSKVESIIQELEPNLRSLRRQVQKWESRTQKETELKEIEREYFSYKIADIERAFDAEDSGHADTKAIEKEIARLRTEIQGRQRDLDQGDANDPSLHAARLELETRMRNSQAKQAEASHALGMIEGKLQMFLSLEKHPAGVRVDEAVKKLEHIRQLLSDMASLDDLSQVRKGIRDVMRDIEGFLAPKGASTERDGEEDALQKQKQEINRTIEQEARAIASCAKELETMERAVLDRSAALRTAMKDLDSLRTAMQEQESLRERALFAKERKQLKQDDIRMRLEEAGYQWDAFVGENKDLIAQPLSQEYPVGDAETKMIRLRRDLALIGELDEEVVKAHRDATERYEFLTQQKQDLDKALFDLDALDASLEEKIRTGFETALRDIDAEFNKYFQIIFDGGKASVSVVRMEESADSTTTDGLPSDDSDIDAEGGKQKVESGTGELGVDFSVHLPRKKIKSVEMLSGGERSLTAIALLFAIISAAKPPLLVLDEIDAALDEANSQKFAKLLRAMITDVQFIIITHNRSIMESADILYGVTMQDGVSKVFSLRFSQAEELAAQDKTS